MNLYTVEFAYTFIVASAITAYPVGPFSAAGISFMMTRSRQRPTAAKRARARHTHTEPLPADRLFKIADAAESIADNLRALTLPNAEDWLRKSVRDWYETTGRELRSLGLLD